MSFLSLLMLSFVQTNAEISRQVFTSNKGVLNTDGIYQGSYLVSSQQYLNEPFIDSIFTSTVQLDVSTQIYFNNYSVNGDVLIDTVKLLTNFKAIYLSPSSFKNFSIIKFRKNSISGSLSIKNTEVSNQINGNIINLESNLMTSIHLDNVVVEKDLIISTNTLSHSILIENSVIKGNLVIDGVRIFAGTVIVKNTNVNGFIRIERVLTSKKIDLDQSVKSPYPVGICPSPFFASYNGESFNGCYNYLGKVDTYEQAVSKCSSIGANLITIRNRKIAEDLPKIYTSFSQFYYWIGAYYRNGTFRWQDESVVGSSFWCSGHPSGSNRCTYYTTVPVFGNDKCIKNGDCDSNWFDHGLVCQYLHPYANYYD